LNGLPKLKQFLKFEVAEYENIKVEWVGGHTPTAFFKDEEGNTLEEVVLTNLDHDEMMNFFVLHGLTPKAPKAEFGEPFLSWDYQNHHYEYFTAKVTYPESKEFALERQFNDLPGYPVTLSTAEEEAVLVQQISKAQDGEGVIWLGLEDQAEEGTWAWAVGPESETKVWQGKGTQGSVIDGQYANWREHEPNNANDINEEDCAALTIIKDAAIWNDVPCRWKFAFVVEYGETPIIHVPSDHSSSDPLNVKEVEDPSHEDL